MEADPGDILIWLLPKNLNATVRLTLEEQFRPPEEVLIGKRRVLISVAPAHGPFPQEGFGYTLKIGPFEAKQPAEERPGSPEARTTEPPKIIMPPRA